MWHKRTYLLEQLKSLPLASSFAAVGVGMWYAQALTSDVMAAVLFGAALSLYLQDWRLARSGRRAQGVVMDHQVVEECYIPIIEFQDQTGNIRREAARMGTGAQKPLVGSQVMILYDPTGKRGCQPDIFWWRHICTLALLFFAIVFAVGAVYGK
jgi:hypothetical protein